MYFFGVSLSKKKQVFLELSKIYGIGRSRSNFVCNQLGFGKDIRLNALSRSHAYSLKDFLNFVYTLDVERMRNIQEAIETLKGVGCYRGMRHGLRLPVRGQRTGSNARTVKKK